MENIKYYCERGYPYFVAIIVMVFLNRNNINFIMNDNFNDAIDGISTISSLIIGFLGAILPVILGMKNESKFVKYVFENDTNKLFLKYIKEDILAGLMVLFLSIVLYFKDDAFFDNLRSYAFYLWAGLIVLFLLLTYRCLTNMLELIFSSDNKLENVLYSESDEEVKERRRREEKYRA